MHLVEWFSMGPLYSNCIYSLILPDKRAIILIVVCFVYLGRSVEGHMLVSMKNSWTVPGSYKSTSLDSQYRLTSCLLA